MSDEEFCLITDADFDCLSGHWSFRVCGEGTNLPLHGIKMTSIESSRLEEAFKDIQSNRQPSTTTVTPKPPNHHPAPDADASETAPGMVTTASLGNLLWYLTTLRVKGFFSHIWPEFPLSHLKTISSAPLTAGTVEETGSHLTTTSLEGAVESNEVSLETPKD